MSDQKIDLKDFIESFLREELCQPRSGNYLEHALSYKIEETSNLIRSAMYNTLDNMINRGIVVLLNDQYVLVLKQDRSESPPPAITPFSSASSLVEKNKVETDFRRLP